jgi:hypothetical protein
MAQLKSFTIYTLGSGTSKAAIEPVLDLSNEIFASTSSPPTHHSSLEEWHRRLSQPVSILVCGTETSLSVTSRQVTTNNKARPSFAPFGPIGFIFAHRRPCPSLPYPTLHIWLAGVSERARGMGLFAALMDEVERHARNEGIQTLSVCTFPATFGQMFAILQTHAWEVKVWMDDGKKVLMTKGVSELI